MIKSQTCLAVVRDDKGKLWFAGDRRSSWHFGKAIKGPRPKVTKKNGILLAGTGVASICDLVTERFEVPKQEDKETSMQYMVRFEDELLAWLREEKWVKEDSRCLTKQGEEEEHELMAIILVGVGSDLYEVDLACTSPLQSTPIDAPYGAGCGGSLAWGSLLTSAKLGWTEKKRLKEALKVAAKVSPGCDDNIDILHN
jgi:hypothetical protein